MRGKNWGDKGISSTTSYNNNIYGRRRDIIIMLPSLSFVFCFLMLSFQGVFLVVSSAVTTNNNAGHRRCIGQFFANYKANNSGSGGIGNGNGNTKAEDDENSIDSNSNSKTKGSKYQRSSVLDWLNESTSCDSPSLPSTVSSSSSSYPSWKRKMKNLVPDNNSNNNNNNNKISSETNTTAEEEDRPYHVVLPLMKYHPIPYEIVTGLIVAGVDVTILYIHDDQDYDEGADDEPNKDHKHKQKTSINTTAEMITSNIFSRIPLYDNYFERARDSFTLIDLYMNDNEYDNTIIDDDCRNTSNSIAAAAADHPLEKCEIEIAPSVFNLLQQNIKKYIKPKSSNGEEGKYNNNNNDNNMNSSYDDNKNKVKDESSKDSNKNNNEFDDFIMMMDASFLGGLLFSEIYMIPTITIGSHRTLKLAVEHEPNWSPSPKQTTIHRLNRIIRQRLYSLGLTSVFVGANKMRHSLLGLHLQSYKSPIDVFLSVVALLVPNDDTLSSSSISPSRPKEMKGRSSSKEKYSSEGGGGVYLGGRGYDNNRVHHIQPFLSPCTPCLGQPAASSRDVERNDNATVIMVAPPVGKSSKWTRSLVRALSLTRQSLEGYDECLFDRSSCQNTVLGFEVDWFKTQEEEEEEEEEGVTDTFPPVVPSFIHNKTSNSLLDSAIGNPNTIIALIFCGYESSILSTLGVEIFCISRSDRIIGDAYGDYFGGSTVDLNDRDPSSQLLLKSLNQDTLDPEEIAIQLLKVLRRKSIGFTKSTTSGTIHSVDKRNKGVATDVTDGLQRMLAIVQAAAHVNRENNWDSLHDMQRVTSKAIMVALDSIDLIVDIDIKQIKSQDAASQFDDQQPYDAFTVFIAWLVFLSATIYIILKDSVLMSRLRSHKNHHHHHHHHHHRNGKSIYDGILSSLSDLDDAWETFLHWSAIVVEIFDNNDHLAVSDADAVDNNENKQQLQHNSNNLQHQNQHNNHHPHGHARRRRKTKTTR